MNTHINSKWKELADSLKSTKTINPTSKNTMLIHKSLALYLLHWWHRADSDSSNKTPSMHLSNICPYHSSEIPGSQSLQLWPASLHHLCLWDPRAAARPHRPGPRGLWNHSVCWPFIPTSAWLSPWPHTTALFHHQVQDHTERFHNFWVFECVLVFCPSRKYQSLSLYVDMFVLLWICASPCRLSHKSISYSVPITAHPRWLCCHRPSRVSGYERRDEPATSCAGCHVDLAHVAFPFLHFIHIADGLTCSDM